MIDDALILALTGGGGGGSTFKTFNPNWVTNSTTIAFCNSVSEDSDVKAGMVYLGELTCNDLPSTLVNVEAVVEVIEDRGASGKVIHIIVTSGNVSPYRWEYTYWDNGLHTTPGWIGYQTEINANNQLSSDYVFDNGNSHRFVTQEMYEYLENITYKAPAVSTLDIYNSSNVKLASSYETGSTVTLGKAVHKETNITNISGDLTLKYKLGSAAEVEVSNAVAPSATNAEVIISDTTLTLSNTGKLKFSLSGTNTRGGSVSGTSEISINDYAYMIASDSDTPPITGLSKAGTISAFAQNGAGISYNAGQYLYFYVLGSGGTVEHLALGVWSNVEGSRELDGTYQITKANGTQGTYHVYRVGRTLSGLTDDVFRVRATQ